jgi:hypothetical protein
VEIRLTDFVDFVEEDDGVWAGGFAEGLDYEPGAGCDVGASVTADFGFVADAAEGDALEGAVEGSGDGLAEGGFAGAGGTDEEEDWAFGGCG